MSVRYGHLYILDLESHKLLYITLVLVLSLREGDALLSIRQTFLDGTCYPILLHSTTRLTLEL